MYAQSRTESGANQIEIRVVVARRRAPAEIKVESNSENEEPGESVHGERANFTGLVLGCVEAKFCKTW